MMNYKIYTNENSSECIVEIFNRSDIMDVQKQLIDKGYMIDHMIDYGYHGHAFMMVKNMEVKNHED